MKLSDFDFRIWDGEKYIKLKNDGGNDSITHRCEGYAIGLIGDEKTIYNIKAGVEYNGYTYDDYKYVENLSVDENKCEIELFTGYFDKNGNKIYENDILMNELTEEIFYITRDDTYKMSEIILYGKDYNGNLYRKRNSGGINLLKMLVSDKNMSVVGNIHENPELLEEGKQWKLANL